MKPGTRHSWQLITQEPLQSCRLFLTDPKYFTEITRDQMCLGWLPTGTAQVDSSQVYLFVLKKDIQTRYKHPCAGMWLCIKCVCSMQTSLCFGKLSPSLPPFAKESSPSLNRDTSCFQAVGKAWLPTQILGLASSCCVDRCFYNHFIPPEVSVQKQSVEFLSPHHLFPRKEKKIEWWRVGEKENMEEARQ